MCFLDLRKFYVRKSQKNWVRKSQNQQSATFADLSNYLSPNLWIFDLRNLFADRPFLHFIAQYSVPQ
jgi:hypothetical protein